MDKFFTVFTPTYNRVHTLRRLYESLCIQRFKKFEWVIVDDGSSDNTKDLVEQFISERRITIVYYKQHNQGKHVAINKGVELATGYAIIIIDSDDWLFEDSLEILHDAWCSIDEAIKKDFSGVAGLSGDMSRKVVGNDYGADIIDVYPVKYSVLHNIKGDKRSFHLTSVFREFPFPVIQGEKFISESIVWSKISNKYKQRLVNKVVVGIEYLPDGLTVASLRLRTSNPIGAMLVYESELRYSSFTIKRFMKNLINYVRFSLHARRLPFVVFNKILNIPVLLVLVPSLVIYLKDKIAIRKHIKI